MKFNPRFGASELSPVIDTHAKVYCGRVKGIELASNAELLVKSARLCKINHMIGECFKDMPVAMCIASGEDIPVNRILPKTKMERLIGMSGGNVCQLTETAAPQQLPKHEDQQLSPIGQLSVRSSTLFLARFSMILSKYRLGKKSAIWLKMYLPVCIEIFI